MDSSGYLKSDDPGEAAFLRRIKSAVETLDRLFESFSFQ